MPNYEETIKSAYESGDLLNEHILKNAMMFENFHNCSEDIQTHLTSSNDWPGLVAKILKPDTKRCFSHLKGQGYDCDTETSLHRVVPTKSITKKVSFPNNIISNIRNTSSASDRVSIFNAALWDNWCTNTESAKRFCWLYQEPQPTKKDNVDLLQDLGLYPLYEKYTSDTFFKMTFKPTKCKKPNWIDAGFTFYFYEAKNTTNHGLTRSLRTGGEYYAELVHNDVASLQLTDVNILSLERNHHFGMLSDEYKHLQCQRIELNRSAKETS